MAYKFNPITGQFDLVGVTILPPGTGDVIGPASSVDEGVVVFDGTTGKIIKDSGVTIDEIVVYSQTFNNTTDWTGPVSNSYTLTVLSSLHNKNSPVVQLFELNATDYIQVEAGVKIDSSDNIIITVNSTPDLRFIGKIVIS